MRWLSPPDSVPEARDRVRYSRPTSLRKVSRSRISLRMRAAISFCFAVRCSGSVSNQALASRIDRSVTWPIWRPAIFTARAWGLRR